MTMKPLLAIVFAVTASATCLPVTGDRILGSDLARADRRFAALPATLQIGYTPVPGMDRTFAAPELRQIARSNGIAWNDTDRTEACFELPIHAPTETEFTTSMRGSLPPAAELHIVEIGHAAIPAGKIEFPLAGLEPLNTENAQLWRGFVQYTETRRLPVWARVKVTVTHAAVIPVKDLAPEIPIEAASLRLETISGPLARESSASRIEDVAGRVLRRFVKAGSEIPIAALEDAPVVRRGDLVRVEVRSGSAVLHFDAVAESNARAGELADLRNPETGRIFRARAEVGSKAVIVVGGAPAL
jgi:flagella basal body P-ring formation protein FlgA